MPGIYGSKRTKSEAKPENKVCHKSLATHAITAHLIGLDCSARSSIVTVAVNK